MLIAVCTTCL